MIGKCNDEGVGTVVLIKLFLYKVSTEASINNNMALKSLHHEKC